MVGGKLGSRDDAKKAQESARRTPEPSPNGPCQLPAVAEASHLSSVMCMTIKIVVAPSKCVVALEQ